MERYSAVDPNMLKLPLSGLFVASVIGVMTRDEGSPGRVRSLWSGHHPTTVGICEAG